MQQRNDEVHHQIGDQLPLDRVEAGQIGIRADRIDHVHAREMIGIVGERRQRMRRDRKRGRRHQQYEQNDNGRNAETARRLARKAQHDCFYPHLSGRRLAAGAGCEASRPGRLDGI